MASLPVAGTTILLMKGTARVKRGKVRSALISELTLLAEAEQIECGSIHVKQVQGRGDRLTFYGIPEALHQRFRNVWNANR